MAGEWNQERIEQEYVLASAEEGTTLEYKAADALGKSGGKKKEITKDVSAMANAAGGMIIYGIKEYDEKGKRHLPEKLDPIDRTQFPREWLDQVINNIRPRIEGLTIFPVDIDTGPNNAVYAVDVPQSTTAHQAADLRYYRRYNFEVLPMLDHEIRDVMNRGTTPDAQVEFSHQGIHHDPEKDVYELGVVVRNQGLIAIRHFKLEFTFPDLKEIPLAWMPARAESISYGREWVNIQVADHSAVSVRREHGIIQVVYRSRNLLFPKDEEDIGRAVRLTYHNNTYIHQNIGDIPPLNWTFYVDDMLPKQGRILFSELVRSSNTSG